MRNITFCFVLLLCFISGISIIILPQDSVSISEKRVLNTNSDIELSNRFAATTEKVLKDQFFERENIINKYYEMNINLGKVFNKLSKNSNYKNVFDDISINYLANGIIEINDGFLLPEIPEYSEYEIKSASSRGFNVNEFDLKYPAIKTYVYFPTRIEEFLNIDHIGQPISRIEYLKQLNSNITTSALKIEDTKDYMDFYFKTEDHWNAIGAYQGYTDIINMISSDFEISSPKEINRLITYPYTFKGNIVNRIGDYGENSDSIMDIELKDVGDFDYYINGVNKDYFETKKDYSSNGNTSIYSDYDYYFGDNAFLREFDFHSEEKPNLLIFGDSYINTNMMWIASHFNKTIIIDLRSKPEDFDLDFYINEYNIDVALVMMSYNTMYLNGYMYIPLE